MLIQPARHCLELAADLVSGEEIEYAGLDGAFLTHCQLRRLQVYLWNQCLDPKITSSRRASADVKTQILQVFSISWRLWMRTSLESVRVIAFSDRAFAT